MAEIVVEGVKKSYAVNPWEIPDERTGQIKSGISHKMKVRVAAPGTGTLTIKVPEDVQDAAQEVELDAKVRLTLDVDLAQKATLTEIVAID